MTVRLLGALAALLAFTAGQAAAAAPAKSHQDCFYARNVNGYSAVGDNILNIRVGVKDVYQLKLMGSCPDLDWNNSIALKSRGSSWICSALDAEVITHSQIGPQRCPVSEMRKLTPAEVAALPPKQKP
jgi:hypothetical protein